MKGKKPREFNDILPENEFISQVVVISEYSSVVSIFLRQFSYEDFHEILFLPDNLPDRNCPNCAKCCFDYILWLRVQNCLYKIVRDPLFELLITICIILNTFFLAVEHHGMSEDLKRLLDIGNKVSLCGFVFMARTYHVKLDQFMTFRASCTEICKVIRTSRWNSPRWWVSTSLGVKMMPDKNRKIVVIFERI